MKLKVKFSHEKDRTHAICGVCGETRARGEFYPKYFGRCIPCEKKRPARKEAMRRYQEKNRALCHARTRDYKIRQKYGINSAQFDAMLAEQGGLCAICRKPEISKFRGALRKLNIDHDHQTNSVRQLLCNRCNHALDRFDHKPGMLKAFADYLEKHGQPQDFRDRLPVEPAL